MKKSSVAFLGLFTAFAMILSYVERFNPDGVTLVSNNISFDGVAVFGGESADALNRVDEKSYTFTDSYIRIAREEN